MNRLLWPTITRALTGLLAVAALTGSAGADPGNLERGEAVYAKRCVWCHGEEGDGLGPAGERLNPPPRDFTAGTYKFKTTGFDDIVPNDDDILRMIRDGMPGTAMPGWGDMLSDQEMWDLIAYLKVFAGLEEEKPEDQVDYGKTIASSVESIAKGKQLFHDGDRCSECHGEQGKGDAIKRLKGDNGERTWPRNLTKPWTYRASNEPKEIFTRITTGIAGTQMPSFADPSSKKKLSVEERWHVANYVSSLAKTQKVVRPENTVIRVAKASGEVPAIVDDPRWDVAPSTTFFLVPQIVAKQRLFTPSNDTITVRGLYDGSRIALLLEWDDRTRSIPGDERAEKIAEPPLAPDAVAVQIPVVIPQGLERPYFGMGDVSKPVNIWHWTSGTTDKPETISLLNSKGAADIQRRDAADAGLRAVSEYRQGTWRVVLSRPLSTEDQTNDPQLVEGRFIPIAFAAWDGSNAEQGSRHTMTTWYWMLLEPPIGNFPWFAALGVFLLVGMGELWWLRSSRSQG